MSKAIRSSSRKALPITAALLFVGCAVGAPVAKDDPFFEQQANDSEDDSDAAEGDTEDPEEVDSGVLEPDAMDSGNALPPWSGATGGSTAGGGAGGTTGGSMGRDAGGGGTRDAGTGTARDAGTTRPPTTPARDAAAPTGCNALTCTNECSLAGPLPCCTLLDTCGCTWAPGAYCI